MFNRDYRYVLIEIVVFSRKAFAQPLINKDGNSIKDAFIHMTKKPSCIISDHDSGFLSEEFSAYLDPLHIPLKCQCARRPSRLRNY